MEAKQLTDEELKEILREEIEEELEAERKEKEKQAFYRDFTLQREMDSLKAMIEVIDFMRSGYLPELSNTKKAAQEAIKELCAAICSQIE